MKRVLLTGAAGFAGSHIAEHIVATTDWKIVALDRLSYAGRLDRLKDIPRGRIEFVCHDFRSPFHSPILRQLGKLDYIIHNGAETHVLRSLSEPEVFVQSNVIGTFHVLEMAKLVGCERFLYTSTDEVFGPAPEGVSYRESDPPHPANPYSASKASGEMFCHAYANSYDLSLLITRTMNLYGERQHPEKFVPLVIGKLVKGERVPIHCSKEGIVGARNWIHARDWADAALFLLRNGTAGETYHVAGMEYTNEEMASLISGFSGLPLHMERVDAATHRPGHDLRYALDDSKIRRMGWQEPERAGDALALTVKWYLENKDWLEP